MKPVKPEDIPQNLVDLMSPKQREELGLVSTSMAAQRRETALLKSIKDDEKRIQRTVEAYLVQLGYERRTPENIGRGMPRSGWFIHLHETKRNPILLDLLILSHTGKYLELELKTKDGAVRTEQKALIAQGASLARAEEEAIHLIQEWHRHCVSPYLSDSGEQPSQPDQSPAPKAE